MTNLLFNSLNNLLQQGKFISLAVFICFVTVLNAQTNSNNFITVNGFYGSRLIEVPYDGGYLIIVTQHSNRRINAIKKINRKGDVLWTVKPEIQDTMLIMDLSFLSNNDIIVSGSTSEYWSPYLPETAQSVDGVLFKINTCGEIEWLNIERRHGDTKVADGLRLQAVNSNDEIWVQQYCHYTSSQKDSLADGKNGGHFVMNKYNSDGDLLETTDDLFSGPGEIQDLIATDDGGVIIVGHSPFLPFYNQVYDPINNPSSFTRGLVMKYDTYGEIEWFNAYRWEEDQSYMSVGIPKAINDSIIASKASGILPTDSNTFIISAFQFFYDTLNMHYYNKFLLYEIDINGNILRDTLYDYTKNVGYTPLDVLNDTTFILTSNSKPYGEWGGAPEYELEVWKMDSRTWEIKDRYIDTNHNYYESSNSAVSSEGKILTMSYQTNNTVTKIRVIDPITMELDSIPVIDTNSYDYLCSGVFSADEIDLPDDTAYYEPIGFVELNNIEVSIYIKNKVLSFEGLDSENYSYDIVNILGQLVYKGNTNEGNQDISQLNRGVYIIRFNESVQSIKFVLE